jgi:hypothetical protein
VNEPLLPLQQHAVGLGNADQVSHRVPPLLRGEHRSELPKSLTNLGFSIPFDEDRCGLYDDLPDGGVLLILPRLKGLRQDPELAVAEVMVGAVGESNVHNRKIVGRRPGVGGIHNRRVGA